MAARTNPSFAAAIARATRCSVSSSPLTPPPQSPSPLLAASAHEPPKQTGSLPSPSPTAHPPSDWDHVYTLIRRMRLANPTAPVDTLGCSSLALPSDPPQVQRFQTLVSLMLSSQTKDLVTAAAVRKLQASLDGGLTLESVIAVEEKVLDEMIHPVGFHSRKAGYLKRTAVILRDQWEGDVPATIEGLLSLPGVGMKMAQLCLPAAWGRVEGIGVDVHVHRICNLLGWVGTKTPEETRRALEGWLPREMWGEVNGMLVGFGQTICLPRGRRCGECTVAEEGRCPSAFKGDAARVKGGKGRKRKPKEESDEEVKVEYEVDLQVKGEDGWEEEVAQEVKKEAAKTPERRSGRKRIKVEYKDDDSPGDIEDVLS